MSARHLLAVLPALLLSAPALPALAQEEKRQEELITPEVPLAIELGYLDEAAAILNRDWNKCVFGKDDRQPCHFVWQMYEQVNEMARERKRAVAGFAQSRIPVELSDALRAGDGTARRAALDAAIGACERDRRWAGACGHIHEAGVKVAEAVDDPALLRRELRALFAARVAIHAVPVFDGKSEPFSDDTERVAYRLASLLTDDGRHADAETLYRRVCESEDSAPATTNLPWRGCATRRAGSLRRMGRFAEASALLEQRLDMKYDGARGTIGEAQARAELARDQAGEGRIAEALANARRATRDLGDRLSDFDDDAKMREALAPQRVAYRALIAVAWVAAQSSPATPGGR